MWDWHSLCVFCLILPLGPTEKDTFKYCQSFVEIATTVTTIAIETETIKVKIDPAQCKGRFSV